MNGTMMGYSRQEMDAKLPEILEFADIGDFVYQPCKTYSSGMFVRLAFALAINVDPEILIVDEALAVGDVFFQAKCYKKINEIRESGTTVILVTHDMGTIIKYCDKVVVLNRGKFVDEGDPGKMVDLYKKILAGQFSEEDLEGIGQKADFADQLLKEAEGTANAGVENSAENKNTKTSSKETLTSSVNSNIAAEVWMDKLSTNAQQLKYGNGAADIIDVGIFDHKNEFSNVLLKGRSWTLKIKVRFNEQVKDPIFAFTIKDSKGTEITGTNTMIEGCDTGVAEAGDVVVATFEQNMDLQGKDYLLSLGCTGFVNGEFVVFDRLYDVANLTVISDKNTVGYFDMNSQVTVERG
jgi:teichoic acid transport system ATP-binding protein